MFFNGHEFIYFCLIKTFAIYLQKKKHLSKEIDRECFALFFLNTMAFRINKTFKVGTLQKYKKYFLKFRFEFKRKMKVSLFEENKYIIFPAIYYTILYKLKIQTKFILLLPNESCNHEESRYLT